MASRRSTVEPAELARLLAGESGQPHRVLGPHRAGSGAVVRAFEPAASRAFALFGDEAVELHREDPAGTFTAEIPGSRRDAPYRLRFEYPDGHHHERGDPYRFPPLLGELDLHLIHEGTHRRLYEKLGAHPCRHGGESGVAFAVWAPTARRVSVLGDFCDWDGRRLPMRRAGEGIFELFVPDVEPGARYKYEILTADRRIRLKTDPVAFRMEHEPGFASVVAPPARHVFGDHAWLRSRASRDPAREPLLVYEVHLGSWRRDPADPERPLSYREIAPLLADHARELGVTHVELLPVMEHPYGASWGYQVAGYYAPTSRHGTPDDFRFFVDTLHGAGIGVLLDWVPAHFPRDDFALRRFDGTALYEHLDPRLGEHPDWGTLIFNFGRPEVRNFLIANALYWIREFHADGLRVDAVASMLYLDYSRDEGAWIPNRYGGRENLEALEFLRELNRVVSEEHSDAILVAEESTAWPGVTAPVERGGLGFAFKWNMGWMHDTLRFFRREPEHRRWHHDELTFAAMYEWSERFLMPLSHDEVVHGKGSLLGKMPGDRWRRFANLRTLLAYQVTRPGKVLWFMGTELAPDAEWSHETGLDWTLADEPMRAAFGRFVRALGSLYRAEPCLYRGDPDPEGFRWITCDDRERSVFAYLRLHEEAHVLCILNLVPEPREGYRLGVPAAGPYRVLLDSDRGDFGGSGHPIPERVEVQAEPSHGHSRSVVLSLPPLAALVLAPGDPA